MIELKQTKTYEKWEAPLRDKPARTIIAARLMRLAEGLPGDKSTQARDIAIAKKLANEWSEHGA